MLPKKQWSIEKQRKRKKNHKISVLKGSAEDIQTGVTDIITDWAYITIQEVTRNLKVCQNTWRGRIREDSHGRLRPWQPRRADVFLWVISPVASPTGENSLKINNPLSGYLENITTTPAWPFPRVVLRNHQGHHTDSLALPIMGRFILRKLTVTLIPLKNVLLSLTCEALSAPPFALSLCLVGAV